MNENFQKNFSRHLKILYSFITLQLAVLGILVFSTYILPYYKVKLEQEDKLYGKKLECYFYNDVDSDIDIKYPTGENVRGSDLQRICVTLDAVCRNNCQIIPDIITREIRNYKHEVRKLKERLTKLQKIRNHEFRRRRSSSISEEECKILLEEEWKVEHGTHEPTGNYCIQLSSLEKFVRRTIGLIRQSSPEHGVGEKGQKGESDIKGNTGDKGERERGISGNDGILREKGIKGISEKNGKRCPIGPSGFQCLPGLKGKRGIPGIPEIGGIPGQKRKDGIPGLPGLPGFKGEREEEGVAGVPGITGQEGKDGIPGLPGLPGFKGERGEEGVAGVPGKAGKDGIPGFPGLPGVKGERGEKGVAGVPGITGQEVKDGIPGLPGPPGLPGLRGFPGLKGEKGEKGKSCDFESRTEDH